MRPGAKSTWNFIRSLGIIGRGYIGMKVIPKNIIKSMQVMILLKMTMKTFRLTGFILLRRQPYTQETHNHTFGRNRKEDTMNKLGMIRDKFEFDRERRMRDKAFAPMRFTEPDASSRNQSFDAIHFSSSDSD
ncbi:hypothetical protein R6Q59_033740 [Mikania micrantha]